MSLSAVATTSLMPLAFVKRIAWRWGSQSNACAAEGELRF
jgi:hypothetical protein